MSRHYENLVFISSLKDLVCSDIPLEKALCVLSETKVLPQKVMDAAFEIYTSLESGQPFSLALSMCSSLCFEESDVSFIACAEQTGNMGEVLSFLEKAFLKIKESVSNIKMLFAYPVFIFILLAVSSAVLFCFGADVFPQDLLGSDTSDFFRQKLLEGIVFGAIFVVIFCSVLIFFGILVFRPDIKTYSFYALFFLLKAGVPLYQALMCALQIASGNRVLESFFSKILENLQQGNPCFSNEKGLDSYCCQIFSVHQNTGSLQAAFETIARHYEKKTLCRRQLFMRFTEPLLLCAVAGYVLILLLHCISGFA